MDGNRRVGVKYTVVGRETEERGQECGGAEEVD